MAGRLLPATEAPSTGERIESVLVLRNLTIDQILSGRVEGRRDYLQDADEWVIVLAGAAVLEVAGECRDLGPGDWALLPAGLAHSLVSVDPGTTWLAVHLRPE